MTLHYREDNPRIYQSLEQKCTPLKFEILRQSKSKGIWCGRRRRTVSVTVRGDLGIGKNGVEVKDKNGVEIKFTVKGDWALTEKFS